MSTLFRDEVVARHQRGPWQPPFLSRPLPGYALSVLCAAATAALVVFATTFEFARTEQALGRLSPVAGWATVSTRSHGVVRERHVDSGDRVHAGDLLVDLSSLEGIGPALLVNDQVFDKLDALRQVLEAKAVLLEQRLAGALALSASEHAQGTGALASAEEDVERAEALAAIAERRLETGRQLLGTGMLSGGAFLDLEEALQRERLALSERHTEVARLRWAVDVMHTKAANTRLDFESQRLLLAEQMERLALEDARLRALEGPRILAPRSGVVASIRVDVGDRVQPGQQILDILPSVKPLQARLFVPSAAAGFVAEGQEVRVFVDGFPYERYGAPVGVVHSVSETTYDDVRDHPGASLTGEAVFRVDVRFPKGLDDMGTGISFRPGMLVTAELIRDYRTLADWALDPLRSSTRRF